MATAFVRILLVCLLLGNALLAIDLTIRLEGSDPATHKKVRYQCDANGPKLGLPAGPFEVEYINAGESSLAVLPISKQSLIFANVISASGARYAAKQLIWWDAAGRSVSLSSESMGGDKIQSFCKPAK